MASNSMKKGVITQFGDHSVLKIINTEIPIPKSNEILVKVHAAGLNPKDVLIRKGKFKRFTGSKFPQGIGFDFAGIVQDSNGSNFQEGDRVFGMINGWQGRTCSEYLNVSINEVRKAPPNISFTELAGIPLAGQTALQAIRDLGKIKPNYEILINGGSGGVGSLAIQIAKELGGIVTSVSSAENIEFCKSRGAHKTIAYNKSDLLKSGEKYQVFFDVFGNYSYQRIKHLLDKNGRYITTVPKSSIIREQLLNPFRKQKAKLVYVKSNDSDLNWFVEKIEQGAIQAVIDTVKPLVEIADLQALIETKRSKGKMIVKVIPD